MDENKVRKYFFKDDVYMCSVCDKTQTSLRRMQNHILTHTEYECEVCSKKFKVKHHLDNHMVMHVKGGGIACSQCGKTFAHARYLEQHVKNTHSNLKRFICEVCGKQFNQLVHLKTHSVSHKLQKPFSCERCKKKYACKASLMRHSEVHDKKQPFVCEHCNKRFTRKETFVLHVRVIHEKKAHQCAECGVAFGQKAYLKSHYLRSHMKVEMDTINNNIKNSLPRRDTEPSEVQLTFSISILNPANPDPLKVEPDAELLKGPNEMKPDHDLADQHAADRSTPDVHIAIDSQSESLLDRNLFNDDIVPNLDTQTKTDSVTSQESYYPTVANHENPTARPTMSDKELNISLPLFADSPALDILSPPNLETDFLLGSFGNWESTNPLENDMLSECPIDLDCSQDFNSKGYLAAISDEYFTSLQCTMPF